MGTGGPFPWGKARPGRDADHSPPSNAEVMNELEVYLLSPQAPPWRVVGLLYFFFTFLCNSVSVVSLRGLFFWNQLTALSEGWLYYSVALEIFSLY
jgi:hypothetical protein